jgi:hypothetical protein
MSGTCVSEVSGIADGVAVSFAVVAEVDADACFCFF